MKSKDLRADHPTFVPAPAPPRERTARLDIAAPAAENGEASTLTWHRSYIELEKRAALLRNSLAAV